MVCLKCVFIVPVFLLVISFARASSSTEIRDLALEEYPFHAVVKSTSQCGGMLISKDYVVTRADCVNGSATVTVYLGSQSSAYPTSNPEKSVQTFSNSRVIVHDNFAKSNKEYLNDIALVKLSSSAIFSNKIRPGIIMSSEEVALLSNVSVNLTGWIKEHLKISQVHILNPEVCKNKLSSQLCLKWDNQITNSPGSCISMNGKIIGFITLNEFKISDAGENISTEINISAFLNWISRETGISVEELTGIRNECRESQEKVIILIQQIFKKLENLENKIENNENTLLKQAEQIANLSRIVESSGSEILRLLNSDPPAA